MDIGITATFNVGAPESTRVNFRDLRGQRFAQLVVISRATNAKNGGTRWNVICDCGTDKVVCGSVLVSGRTRSCGCARRGELARAAKNASMKALHRFRRRRKVCINSPEHGKAYRGGRCYACWDKKLTAERAAWKARAA